MVIGNLKISSKRLNCELVLLVLIVRRLRIGRSRNLGSIWEMGKRFITSPNRPDWLWGASQRPIQWAKWTLPQNVKRILYIHLVQRLGMSGAGTSTPSVPSWPVQGQIYPHVHLQEKYHWPVWGNTKEGEDLFRQLVEFRAHKATLLLVLDTAA